MTRPGIEPRNFDLQSQTDLQSLQVSIFSLRILVRQTYLVWPIIKIAQQNEPQEMETPLYNGMKTTVIIVFLQSIRLEIY